MLVCLIVSSVLYMIDISVSMMMIGVVYWDVFGNIGR